MNEWCAAEFLFFSLHLSGLIHSYICPTNVCRRTATSQAYAECWVSTGSCEGKYKMPAFSAGCRCNLASVQLLGRTVCLSHGKEDRCRAYSSEKIAQISLTFFSGTFFIGCILGLNHYHSFQSLQDRGSWLAITAGSQHGGTAWDFVHISQYPLQVVQACA